MHLTKTVNFSKTVEAVMKQKEMKKSDLARLTEYSYQYISDLLSGERRWNEDTMNKVCEVLGIQVAYNLVIPIVEDEAGEHGMQIRCEEDHHDHHSPYTPPVG